VAAKALRPSIEIVGVEALLYPSFHNAIRGDSLPIGGASLAEGIAVKTVGQQPLPVVRDLVSAICLVDEAAIERAVNAYATLQRTMAEGAGAAGLAAMLADPDRFRGKQVGLVLCGGNIDARILASVMVRELERDDRIASFRITSNDRPGILGRLASRLGELGANILEVSHGRLFLDVPAKGVTIDVTIETRDGRHTAEVFAALAADGLAPKRLDSRGLSEMAY
jgi:threonine dehydratase